MPVTHPPPPISPQPVFAPGLGIDDDGPYWAQSVVLPWTGEPFGVSSTGRLIGAPCCCGNETICVVQCGTIPVVGATVQILSGSTVVASCITGTTGCCQVGVSGSYTVTVTVSGTVVYSATRTLTAGGRLIVGIGSAGLICCGGFAIPTSFTLTDAVGSLAFDYDPYSYYTVWYGGHAVNLTSCTVTTPSNICVAANPSTGPVRVCYQMICYAGTHPTFSFQRSWSWVYEQGTLTPIWYQDPSGFVAGQPCATGPPAMCGSPHTDISTDSKDPTTTSPFAISFSPSPAISNYTSDPVGGTVAIS